LHRLGVLPITPKRDDNSIFKQPLGYVFYCIGLTADYAARPHDTVEAHSALISRLLQADNYHRLVYLSSTRLYDFANGAGDESADISLNPANPRHVYDLSKMLGEWLCLNASHAKARVARLASVYSHDLRDRNFLHQMVERAVSGGDFTADSTASAARDYVYIDDVCDALIAIAARGKQPIYNIASGQNVRNDELFAMIAESGGARIAAGRPDTAANPPVVDISALRGDFGLHPVQLRDKMKTIINHNKLLGNGTR
jgi:nucleoside-diphosphate-sugar epimerase